MNISMLCGIVTALILCISLGSCSGEKALRRTDTTTSGVVGFACDESLRPLIGRQADVFESLYGKSGLISHYTGEAETMDLLLRDSIRLCFLSRDLTPDEREYLAVKNPQATPRSRRIAADGIAVITNPGNPTQRLSTTELAYIMMGWATRWEDISGPAELGNITVVFDGPDSGAARFIRDSVCAGGRFTDRLRALKSSQEVIEYVALNPGTLGIIGTGWISNPGEPARSGFNDRIKVLAISNSHPATDHNSFLPYPVHIHLREYPLTRDIYYVLTDLKGTLPSGFANFIASDRGQRIVLKSGLVPHNPPLRTIRTREKI